MMNLYTNNICSFLPVFSVFPYIGALIAAGFQTILMLGYVWFSREYADLQYSLNKKNVIEKLLSPLRKIFERFYFGFGVIMLDISFFWLIGQYSYADWRFQLPSVLISLTAGAQYVLWFGFRKPKIHEFIFNLILCGIVIYFLNFYVSASGHRAGLFVAAIIYSVLSCILIAVLEWLIEFFSTLILKNLNKEHGVSEANHASKEPESLTMEHRGYLTILTKPLWNIEMKIEKFANLKTNIFLWLISLANGFLVLWGYSLFSF